MLGHPAVLAWAEHSGLHLRLDPSCRTEFCAMPIVFQCPDGHRITVSEQAAGREIRCPHCGVMAKAPAAPAPSPPPSAPPLPVSASPSLPVPPAARAAVPPEPPPAAAVPPPPPARPGYECPASERKAILGVVLAVAAVAFSLAAPACYELVAHWSASASSGVARWAFVLLLLAVVQAAYATYVWQAPDWGSVLAVALLELSVAMGLAFVFGLLVAGKSEHELVRWLGMTDALRSDLARLWCFFALAVASGAAFGSGRYGFAWRRRLVR